MNADGSFGSWGYAVVSEISKVGEAVRRAATSTGAGAVVKDIQR